MSITIPGINLKKLQSQFDWKLLLFLVLFLDVKLVVKIAALVLIYVLQPDFKLGFRFKESRLPLFYPLIMAIAVVAAALNADYSQHNYIAVFISGLFSWLLCILAIHQVKLAVERNNTEVLHKTLLLFFLVNIAISVLNIAVIVWKSHAINPYTYQGQFQKYFMNTGDYIKGLSFDTSTTNAIISAFGVVYFLTRKNALMVLACMAVLLLTTSNALNIILTLILALFFIFKSTRAQKSLIAICVFMLVVFIIKISPQNNEYVVKSFNNLLGRPNPPDYVPIPKVIPLRLRPDSTLTFEEKREKIAQNFIDSLNTVHRPAVKRIAYSSKVPLLLTEQGRIFVPQPDINSAPYQNLAITPPEQLPLVAFIEQNKASLPLSGAPFHWSGTPGKLTSMKQSVAFLKAHPLKLVAGDGMGNFSSKLAFKATGLGISGGFPAKFRYIAHDFLVNHLDIYLNYFSKRAGYHSLTNSPFSVYDQLLTEYGVLGLLAFFVFYLGYFAKNIKLLTYGLPVLLIICAVMFIDYWFEQLSILILFELMLLLDIKESTAKTQLKYEHQ